MRVVFYCESDGSVPVLDWLIKEVLKKDKKLFAWCYDAIELLETYGMKLERPYVAYLRDDVYELRIKYYRENYRILFFYHKSEETIVVLTNGLKKESTVPDKNIDFAISRKRIFNSNPEVHTYEE